MIIERPKEVERVAKIGKWALVYGRRKTGKSFLVENFLKYDKYFFVKRDKTIISKKENQIIPYDAFLQILRTNIEDNKTIVIDEFHRLGDDFLDILHASKKNGKIILISSTLFLAKKLLDSHSPLLGIVAENPVHLIKIKDTLACLKSFDLDRRIYLEIGILLREPLTIDYFDSKISPSNIFANTLLGCIKTIPALIGEIFTEEERTLSSIYEAVLRAIANGNVISGEISSRLFSKKLINKDDPSTIQQYLDNLVNFGIIKKIKVYNKNRFVYKHVSSLARIFYYADEKYNISERLMTISEIENITDIVLPKIMEDEIREFLAIEFSLTESLAEGKDYDVDVLLLKFNKPEIAAEIKWQKTIKKEDLRRAEEVLSKMPVKRRLFFVPDKKSVKFTSDILEMVDISDFLGKKEKISA